MPDWNVSIQPMTCSPGSDYRGQLGRDFTTVNSNSERGKKESRQYESQELSNISIDFIEHYRVLLFQEASVCL